jgi:hypothetical protein
VSSAPRDHGDQALKIVAHHQMITDDPAGTLRRVAAAAR